jgi:hypothetical protein
MSRLIHEAASTIVELINSSPRSPRREEIEAVIARAVSSPASSLADHHHERLAKIAPEIEASSDLRIRLHKAMAGYDEALAVAAKTMGPEFKAAEAQQVAWGEEIAALEKEIPNPPRCYEDLVARAESPATAAT